MVLVKLVRLENYISSFITQQEFLLTYPHRVSQLLETGNLWDIHNDSCLLYCHISGYICTDGSHLYIHQYLQRWRQWKVITISLSRTQVIIFKVNILQNCQRLHFSPCGWDVESNNLVQVLALPLIHWFPFVVLLPTMLKVLFLASSTPPSL